MSKVVVKVGRNERCPCNSGKKYKHCCLNKYKSKKLVLTLNDAKPRTPKEFADESLKRTYRQV